MAISSAQARNVLRVNLLVCILDFLEARDWYRQVAGSLACTFRVRADDAIAYASRHR
ncbi:MAG: hypothetical protein KDH17_01005 [Rhodocyclaceae bacterium]|nr:hypothetical protein [Rhodocyclaceae bacterium]